MTHPPPDRGAHLTPLLERARHRMRRVLVWTSLAGVASLALASVVVLGGMDYLLRFPAWLRWLHLLAGCAALAWVIRRRVLPAWRFRPTLTAVALHIESRRPALRDALTSGYELSGAPDSGSPTQRALTHLAARRAAAQVPDTAAQGLIDRRPLAHAALSLVAVCAGAVALSVLAPQSSATAAVRTVAPWAGVQWPKRTQIESATAALRHPKGEPLPLRSVVTRSVYDTADTEVAVRVRVLEDGQVIDRYRLLAGWQNRRGNGAATGADGELFETIVTAAGDAIEFRFESIDDTTEWQRTELIDRPEIVTASATVRRPAYVIATAPASEPAELTLDMGRGLDERALAPASLLGSTVRLSLTLNKPLPTNADSSEWLASTFGGIAEQLRVEAPDDALMWTVSFDLLDSARLDVVLTDEHGIESAEPAVFRFPSISDQPPTAVVLDPALDTTALPQAVVRLRASAQDDVGLASVWTSAQRFIPEGGQPSGRGGAVMPAGDAVILDRASVSAGDVSIEMTGDVALEPFAAQPGDEIRLWATAVDVYGFETGQREPTQSVQRRIFIVSEDEFTEQIRGSLTALRREAIRLYEQQSALERTTSENPLDGPRIRREQEAVARETQRQVERFEQLREQIDTNRLDDPALDALTRGAESLAQSAAQSAQRAAESAASLGNEEERTEAQDRTVEQQQRTADALADLVEMLDRGEDSWTARRNIEKLIRDQQAALDATREIGRDTAGLSPEELSDEQQEELERIAREQGDLSEQARGISSELRAAQEALSESNPAEAAALEQAAQQIEQADVARTMQQASEQAQENRTARAAELQQDAIEELQDALEQLDDAQRARDEQLRRMAQSLVEALEALVADQTSQLEQLVAGAGGLDRAMITLRTRTLAAVQTALAAQEFRGVVPPLQDADASQLQAITALRAQPRDDAAAATAEAESLRHLQDALAEAKRQQEQIEQEAVDRERDELEEAYREALTAQIALRDETHASGEAELNRRTRAQMRRLADAQDELQTELSDLYARTQALADAVVFRFAHAKLDEAMGAASASLRDADADRAERRQNRAITLLLGLIDAMAEEEEEDDGFDEGQNGGGGGGGGQQGGPPELIPGGAQLKLLRTIQSDLLDRTRAVDEGTLPAGDLDSIAPEQRELSELGQQLIDELTADQSPPAGVEPIQEGNGG